MTSYEEFKENPAFSGAIVPNHIQDDTYASILSIEDEKENYTRFIVIKKRTKPFTLVSLNQEKIHLLLCIIPQNDYPGLLYEILKHFALYQVNLSSIISRPTKKKMGTYNFFVEIGIETEKIQMLNQCLDEIKNNVEMMIFGEY
jgi:prephenate dehydratase